jgi:hypothetical protein
MKSRQSLWLAVWMIRITLVDYQVMLFYIFVCSDDDSMMMVPIKKAAE